MSLFPPKRRRGVELMDEPGADPALVVRSLEDVAVANRFFGGTHAVMREMVPLLRERGKNALSLLDVGTGIGDIPVAITRRAAARGGALIAFGADASEASLRARKDPSSHAVCCDARLLPFRTASVDIVFCSQLLHHFSDDCAAALVAEMDRVARLRVIVSDIRRSWIAAAGIWLASYPLRFHPVSRHDGVVSVLRGYTSRELGALVLSAAGMHPRVSLRLGFRITASWTPTRTVNS